MDILDVTFRYVGLTTDLGEIPCICLCYQNKNGAELFFDHVHKYTTSSYSNKHFDINFTRISCKKYSLNVHINDFDNILDTVIRDIDAEHIHKIENQLATFRYLIVVAGYGEDNNFNLLPFRFYHFFKNDIRIDKELVVGNKNCSFNWKSLLE